MAFFWFLVSVVLSIILLRQPKKDNSYAQGYWNGFRAFGDMVRDLIKEKRIDEESLRSLINFGETGGVPQNTTAPGVSGQQVPVNDPEAQFFADTYDNGDEGDDIETAEMLDDTLEMLDVAPRAYSAPVSVSSPQVVEMSAEQKAARSLRNLNIILYTASFLLVAAGALFVASSSSPLTKLISVIIIIAAFYVTGIVMYARSVRLRPAALAFLGTGLALIPFAGLALQQFTNLSTAQSWLITSIAGLIAYFLVAVRLQSLLVSYLTMAFVLSLAGSATAAAASAIVWQFVVIIGVSLAASVIAYVKPKWLPAVFSQPVERSGQIVTPVVLVASLFVFDKLLLSGYEIVFAVATLHYIVAWLQTRSILFETIVRVILYVVFALVAWDIWNGNVAVVAFTMVILLTLQHSYSLYIAAKPHRSLTEQAWLLVLFGLQFILMLFWLGYPLAAEFSTIALSVIGLTSLAAALRLRKVGYGLIGLFVSLILPFVVARGLFVQDLPWWAVATWFMVAAATSLWLYARWRHRSVALRYFMTAAYITYLGFAICAAGLEQLSAFMALIFAATATVLLVASYVARSPGSQIVVPLFVLLTAVSFGSALQITQPWHLIFACVTSAVIVWVMAIIHGYFRQANRQVLMLASGQLLFFMLSTALIFANANANKIIIILLLMAAVNSLVLRWHYQEKAAHLNAIFSVSYVMYFVAAFLAAALVGSAWCMAAATLGVGLFALASYVERRPLMQVVASVLTLVSLSLAAVVINLPLQWHALFVFGGGAVLFYLATFAHHVFGQTARRFEMLVTAQVAVFMVIFGGQSGHFDATVASYVILLSWAALSLGARWWSRDKSEKYSLVFRVSYPVYYVGALLLLSSLASTWSWMVAASVGAALFFVASYIEKRLWLQVVASVLVVVALGFVAILIELPSHWTSLFVFGGSAALFCLAAVLHVAYGQKERQLLMMTVAQVVLVLIALTGVTGHYAATLTAFSILLAWSVVALGLRYYYRDRSTQYVSLFRAFYPIYYAAALLLLPSLATVWSVIALAIGAVIFWIASYIERTPEVSVLGDVLLAITAFVFWDLMNYSEEWKIITIASVLAAIFYASHWLLTSLGDIWRGRAQLLATWLTLGSVIVFLFLDETKVIAVSAMIVALAGTLAIHGWQAKRQNLIETALYIATFGLQRIVGQVWPELNVVLYAHWWAITVVAVALLRRSYKRERLVVAMSLVTLSSGSYALANGGNYQLLFLIEHLALLVAGALLSRSWAIWWGISASAIAILYFLRTYTFLLLAFLGLLLIAIVVWRLMRNNAPTKS